MWPPRQCSGHCPLPKERPILAGGAGTFLLFAQGVAASRKRGLVKCGGLQHGIHCGFGGSGNGQAWLAQYTVAHALLLQHILGYLPQFACAFRKLQQGKQLAVQGACPYKVAFYGDKVEVNNREVVISAPNGQPNYNIKKLAEIFCTEFSNQFGVDIIDFTETVYYN